MTLRLTLLGGFHARVDDGSPLIFARKKAQALLAYLALAADRVHPREKLATLLWGDTPPEAARQSLRQALHAIRQALGPHAAVVVADGDAVSLVGDRIATDVAEFTRMVASADPDALDRAGDLYRGDLLAGLGEQSAAFEEWLVTERVRLHDLAIEALAKLLAHHTRAGATEGAVTTATRLLALDPLQEAVHRALMRLYVRQGRRAAALRQYQLCLSALERELGAEPEAETKQLYQEVLQRRSLEPAGASATTMSGSAGSRRTPGIGRRPSGTGTTASTETTLIGRDAELGTLRDALDDVENGRGWTVMVVGEAGIGKTSLVRALAAEATDRGYRVLLGRSYESEQILPFAPWVDAFRAGGVVMDEEALGGVPPVWRSELARLLPEVATAGLPPASDDQRRLFEGIVQLVAALAAGQPLAIVLEDLHWADEMSVRLISFVARRVREAAVAIIVTAREEELAEAAGLRRAVGELKADGGLVEVRLAPLSRDDTARLVRALSRTGSDAAALADVEERTWRVSEGNPFVVVEMLRAFGEGGALDVPGTVRDVIASRLERLTGRARELAAVAAIIGREFEFALIGRAAGLPDREAAEGLEELVRRRVLHDVGERFDFTHDRIREVVGSRLLTTQRKLLHGAVAKALEALHADDLEAHYATLASHCRAGELWDKAARYLRLAAAQAFRRSAFREAAASYEHALEALRRLAETRERLEETLDIRLAIRPPLVSLGDFAGAFEHLREAEAVAERLGDQRRLGWLSCVIANTSVVVGDGDRARAAGERALAIAASLEDRALEAVTNQFLGNMWVRQGDYRRARSCLDGAVGFLQGDRVRDRFGQIIFPSVFSRGQLARCLSEVGAFVDGIAAGEEALKLAESLDQPVNVIYATHNLGRVYLLRGDLAAAIAVLEKGLALCRTHDIPFWLQELAGPLGRAYALSGRRGAGLSLLEEALARPAASHSFEHSLQMTWLGEVYLESAREVEAVAVAQRALESARRLRARGNEAWALRLMAEIAAHRDLPDVETAEIRYRAALTLADELGMRPLVAHCHLGLGEFLAKLGKRSEARAELIAAADLYRAMQMTFWLAQAEDALGRSGPPRDDSR